MMARDIRVQNKRQKVIDRGLTQLEVWFRSVTKA